MRLAKAAVLFGIPIEPYFERETIDAVYAAAPQQLQNDVLGNPRAYYQCHYCNMDGRIVTNQGTWHVREHTQIDHKIPFSSIRGGSSYDAIVPGLIGYGIAPWGAVAINWANGQQVQIVYNDLDNLWVVCANHNQEKRAKPHFHAHMEMGIGRLLNKT